MSDDIVARLTPLGLELEFLPEPQLRRLANVQHLHTPVRAALPEAVREAQEFTQQALRHAYRAGMGRALPDRFFWARGKGDDDA